MPRYEQDPDDERDLQMERIWDYLDTDKFKDDPDFCLTKSDRLQLDRELERRARNRKREQE